MTTAPRHKAGNVTKALDWLAQRKKAILGFVAPGVVLLVADVSDGSLPTAHEWETIAAACVLTALGIHQIPNKQHTPKG